MADPVGKTILQLELVEGVIDRAKSYMEIHVVGQASSQRIPLTELAARGLSAKEVVQLTHPEIVTDDDFIEFISGTDGTNGKNAFQLAQDGGFTGTQAEWLASLKGTNGTNGVNGKSAFEVAADDGFQGNVTQWLFSLKGTNGNNGLDGKSVYDIALENGFQGSEAEYLATLKGADGTNGMSAYESALANGFVGTEAEFVASLKGADGDDGTNGKSAYQSALDTGFVGTEAQWIASLEGQDGAAGTNGKSAYQEALDGGFVGTEAEWLASLQGADGADGADGDGAAGKSAYELAVEGGFQGTLAQWLASLQAQLTQPNLQALLDQFGWTVKGTLRAKGLDSGISANSFWSNFNFLFDKRINQSNGDINLFATDLIPQKVMEQGFLNAEGIAYFKIVDAPGTTPHDPENPDNPLANFFLNNDGQMGVGTPTDNITLSAASSQITVTIAGVPTIYDLADIGQGGGTPGADGKSAYEVAVVNGFVGTEPEWLLSLKGAAGADGADGTIGVNGKSTYELAVDLGFVGDEAEFLLSQKGEQGDLGPTGPGGKTAYQVALDNGFVGSAQEWLDTLAGKSAYQIARDAGFIGNEAAWLITLIGPKGDVGPAKVIGNLIGILSAVEDLPDPATVTDADYVFIGSHVWMASGGAWFDLGEFQGPPGQDGTGITILGSLPGTGFLPATGDNIGDAWLILKAMWVWQGDHWQEQGQAGLKGDIGPAGPEGLNSFETVKAAIPAVDTMAKYIEFIRGIQGEKGEKGDAVIAFVTDGVLATEAELPEPGVEGHGYLVGTEPSFEFHVYVDAAWVNMGPIQGPQGIQGDVGGVGPEGPTGPIATPKGELAAVGDLPTSGNTKGDYYAIDGHFHSWDGLAWNDLGDFSGPIGPVGPEGPVGAPINAKGEVAAEGDLPAAGNVRGDAYEIAGYIHVYDGVAWVRMGQWRGPAGPAGMSAYDAAVLAGFVGTQPEWIASLKGEKGDVGDTGAVGKPFNFISVLADEAALPTNPAPAVADAYMIGEKYYVWNGAAWAQIPALKGLSLVFVGDYADQAALPVGTLSQVATAAGRVYMHNGTVWVDTGPVGAKGEKGDTGAQGKSAYQFAVDGGFVGDVTAWLASLKGDTGAVGKSLYQDAVDSGAFVGTLPEFIEAQKGANGLSAFEEAIAEGKLPPGSTMDDFLELIRGPIGEDGPAGAAAPAISIIGTLANQAALPAEGVAGTGYAIEDPGAPGVFDCWIWLTSTSSWFNLGHVVGAAGPQGPVGPRGLQGLKGDVGAQGTLWLVFNRDPQAQDGRDGDYFFNSLTQEFFKKTSAVAWASLGHIGGGNLNSPTADGKIKGVVDGEWVDLTIINNLPTTTDGTVYQLVNGAWVKFDVYTLAVLDAAFAGSTTTLDWNLARQFRIVNDTSGAKTINLTNLPGASRAATVVVKVYGKVAAFNWTIPAGHGTLRWFDGAAPTFANDTTTVVFNWDGQEIVGSVPN